MNGDKLHRQGSSGSQKRNHERETSFPDKAAAAAKSEIMKGDKLGRQGGSGQACPFMILLFGCRCRLVSQALSS